MATKPKNSKPKKKKPAKKKTPAPKSARKPPRKKKNVPDTKTRAKSAPPKKKTTKKAKSKTSSGSSAKKGAAQKTVPPNENPTAAPPLAAAPVKRAPQVKMLPRNFLLEVASAIKEAVVPLLESGKGTEIAGHSTSGDVTFEIDVSAERALLNFLKKCQLPVAYYSEDSGYTTFSSGQPTNLLVVDPIDGTRAAKNGFESCVVTVCSTRVIERPTIADVDNGCVMEIKTDRAFYAERGKGARMYVNGHPRKPRISKNTDWERMAWSMTVPARPAELIFPTAARLIDISSLKGGFFGCNSTSFSLTRLLSGQLDACVDIANRYYRDIPEVTTDYFINAGRGAILGICPYDFAAAILIVQEAGCVITDAYGESFDDVLLLDSSLINQRSMIAAANAELHKKLMSFFDTRIQQFETLLKKRK